MDQEKQVIELVRDQELIEQPNEEAILETQVNDQQLANVQKPANDQQLANDQQPTQFDQPKYPDKYVTTLTNLTQGIIPNDVRVIETKVNPNVKPSSSKLPKKLKPWEKKKTTKKSIEITEDASMKASIEEKDKVNTDVVIETANEEALKPAE